MKQDDTDILITPTKRIILPNGDVLRGVRASDSGFNGFGEAYFSYIHYQSIKAWRLHKNHTANFLLPMGKIKVILYKGSKKKPAPGYPKKIILSEDIETYQRLTISPGIWYGFEGLAKPTSLIFSLLNGEHSLDEQETISLQDFFYQWEPENE